MNGAVAESVSETREVTRRLDRNNFGQQISRYQHRCSPALRPRRCLLGRAALPGEPEIDLQRGTAIAKSIDTRARTQSADGKEAEHDKHAVTRKENYHNRTRESYTPGNAGHAETRRFNGNVVLDYGSITPTGHGPQSFYVERGFAARSKDGLV
jgi:hypothetical protein